MAAVSTRAPDRTHRGRLSIPILQTPILRSNSPIFSPVNELGSFEFDRVIKSGSLLKRRKRTNAWDTVRLVLRPNLLSIYKDEQETKLKHQINMSEITAVALRKDRKRKGEHEGVFGLFSPSRNFHLEADTEREAEEWVDILRKEARIDQQEELTIASPSGGQATFGGFARISHSAGRSSIASGAFSSTEALDSIQQSSSLPRAHDYDHASSQRFQGLSDAVNLSSSEMGSFSDNSEIPAFGSLRNMSFSSRYAAPGLGGSSRSGSVLQNAGDLGDSTTLAAQTDARAFYSMNTTITDDERVLWHGYLQCLKNHRGVRQWKRYWVVLRSKHLALYKSDEEYAAILILPLSTILDAVETDPVAKGKDFCMQIITDERSYRFCCANEEDLSRWLGALKSTLALRKKKEAIARPPK